MLKDKARVQKPRKLIRKPKFEIQDSISKSTNQIIHMNPVFQRHQTRNIIPTISDLQIKDTLSHIK